MKKTMFSVFIMLFALLTNLIAQTDCGMTVNNYSSSMNDVTFLNDTTIFVVGGNGLIMKSTDFGNSWKRIKSGTEHDLLKIQFLDSNIGYILASYEILLRTDDGGENWFKIPMKSSIYPSLQDFHFISANLGFVIGKTGKIHKTIDGGKNWEIQDKGTYRLLSVNFVNDSIGYICGNVNTLLKTIDSGNTWNYINMDNYDWRLDFVDISLTDKNEVFLLSRDGKIIKSQDNGITWSHIGSFLTFHAHKICFVDKNIGYIIGGSGSPVFYKTINGGIDWSSINIPVKGIILGIAHINDGAKGVIVGSASPYLEDKGAGHIIMTTEDSGDSWNTVSYLDSWMSFKDIYFVSDSIGYLFGGYSSLEKGYGFKTTNAGLTWKQLPVSTELVLGSCNFFSEDVGYVSSVTSDSIYFTENGGIDWEVIPEMRGTSYFVNKNTGFKFIPEGLQRTTDKGKNWENVYERENGMFLQYDFFNDSLGFAVGFNLALRTIDSGKTWSEIDTFSTYIMHAVSIVNKDTVFIGGDNGLLFYSYDSGLSWEKIETGFEAGIVDLFFNDNSFGVAIINKPGGFGEVFISYDLGMTWTSLMREFEDFHTYANIKGKEGFFIGKSGILMKIENEESPNLPSFIIGDTLVMKDSVYTYSLLYNENEKINWNVENGSILTDYNDSIEMNWSDVGTYSISVNKENACGLSKAREFNVHVVDSIINSTDTLYLDNKDDINISPSITTGLLNISTINYAIENGCIYVVNSMGIVLEEKVIENGFSQINISDLDDKVYFIIIEYEQKKYVKKIVKI